MENEFVAMAKKVCIATGKLYDEGGILIDKKLKPISEEKSVVGAGFCPEVQEKIDEGYQVLVGIDSSKSELQADGTVKPSGAHRTGEVIYLKHKPFREMFQIDVDAEVPPMIFIDETIICTLNEMNKNTK